MSYWKAIRPQAVKIAAFVLKVYEVEAKKAIFNAPLSREKESKLIVAYSKTRR